jgi:uncharacterized protein (DUF2267 family)
VSSTSESDAYWEKIGGKVLRELDRRLDTDEAGELAGTLLMRLAEQYLKYLEKQAAQEEEEQHFMTAMEAIDQEGIPIASKIEILTDYIDKLESDHKGATDRLAELLKEQIGHAS